jgi:hypothetical protein
VTIAIFRTAADRAWGRSHILGASSQPASTAFNVVVAKADFKLECASVCSAAARQRAAV